MVAISNCGHHFTNAIHPLRKRRHHHAPSIDVARIDSMVTKGGYTIMMNDNKYVIFSTEEWDAFKRILGSNMYVDYAHYCDKHNTGQKYWWVYFKSPVSGTQLFMWGQLVYQNILSHRK